MKGPRRCAVFNRERSCRLWLLPILTLAAVAIWCAADAPSAAAQAKTKVNPADGLTYVWIPPATFRMGCSPDDQQCNENETPHSVKLTHGFWIGQTLVTQAAYQKVAGKNPSAFKGDRLPVETVSWDEAKAYCQAVKMRLPTEAEWEYAARGGSTAARYAPLAQIAWYSANSDGKTHDVGQKQANAFGLYDMLGDTWEWVADWYGPYDKNDAVDPKGPRTGRVRILRGAAVGLDEAYVRVSYRSWYDPGYHSYGDGYVNGFRCAGK